MSVKSWPFAFVLTVVFCLASFQVRAQGADDLARIEKEMAERKAAAMQLERAAKQQQAEIEALRRKLIEATEHFQESQVEKSKLENKLGTLESESAARAAVLDASRARLSEMTSALVRLGRAPQLFFAVEENAARDYARRRILLRELLPRLKERTEKLGAEIAYFDDLQRRAAEQKNLMTTAGQSLKQQRLNLDQLVDIRQGKLRKTQAEREEIARQLEALAKEAKNIKQLMEKVTGESWGRTIGRTAALPSLRQGLRNPVSGKVLRFFGQKDEFGVTSEGVTYTAAAGAPVVAPQAGRVVFLGPFQGYGKVVIMQHQGSSHSFIAGLGRIDAEVGQNVDAGEPVGILPAEEGRDEEDLYFEWRVDKKPVDPFLKGLVVKVR